MSGRFKSLRCVQEANVEGKRVLVRVDFNVPLRDGGVGDDSRIRAALPTVQLLRDRGAVPILATHLGRPEGHVVPAMSLRPVADCLAEILGDEVVFLKDCVGDAIRQQILDAPSGTVVLLENVRFHEEEVENQPSFARALADLADVFVNDAFATLHRAHASTSGVADYLPAYAGLLIQHELEALSHLLDDPARPYVAIVGGRKAKSKLGPLRDLVNHVDEILIGGGVAFTFLHAMGMPVGASYVEHSLVDDIREIIRLAEGRHVTLSLPEDVVAAPEIAEGVETRECALEEIPEGWIGLDIGPKTVELFSRRLESARSIIWTGPMGAFETAPFDQGTRRIAEALSKVDAYTVVGGGETGEAIASSGLGDQISHISTGGGACLALLRGKRLPALEALGA
ncbi:phosphoglycerate kinase [Candidatus Bipolaricaulota bacterium]|nr:phosphoglycerate kinase [Candidatus Bipolaricaulota bacterium]